MIENREAPFIIASSVAANVSEPNRFSLEETIRIASGRADGTQLYVNPDRFMGGSEDVSRLRDMLSQSGLTINVSHLPGYAIPRDLISNSARAMDISSDLLEPIPGVGKLCIIHHDPYSRVTDRDIIEAVASAVEGVHDPSIAIGLEHFHPFDKTTQDNLPEQVDKYIALLRRLQEILPAFAVFDTGRFYTANNGNVPPAPLYDPEYQLIRKLCEAFVGQQVLVHVTDKRDVVKPGRHPGNAAPLGEGLLTPHYKKLNELGRRYGIKWIGVVDETEDVDALSDRSAVQEIFS